MTIKSLLLGSARGSRRVSGARAADAVVDRRAGAHGICPHLRHLRRRLLLHPRHRDLPQGRRLCPLRHRRAVGPRALRRCRRGPAMPTAMRTPTTSAPAPVCRSMPVPRPSSARCAARSTSTSTTRRRVALRTIRQTASASTAAFIELGGFRLGKTDSHVLRRSSAVLRSSSDDLIVPYGPYDTYQIAYTFKADAASRLSSVLKKAASTYGNYVTATTMSRTCLAGAAVEAGLGIDRRHRRLRLGDEKKGAFKARLDVKATDQL